MNNIQLKNISKGGLKDVVNSNAFGITVFDHNRSTRCSPCRKWVAHHQQASDDP